MLCSDSFTHVCVCRVAPSVPVISEMRDIQEDTPAAQQQARISASSATRELDELMASLSDFKVQSNVSLLKKTRIKLAWHHVMNSCAILFCRFAVIESVCFHILKSLTGCLVFM